MDAISSTTSVANTVATETVPEARSDISADFDTFLQLLTAQLRNQDPLNPVESTEFIAQLASFSSVEQQTLTNELLSDFLDQASGESPAQLANWIGQEVAVPGPFEATPEEARTFTFTPIEGAISSELVIRSDTGALIAKRPIEAGTQSVEWDGLVDPGGAPISGDLIATVEGFVDGEPAVTAAATFGKVTEVRIDTSGAILIVEDLGQVDPDSILAVKAAG